MWGRPASSKSTRRGSTWISRTGRPSSTPPRRRSHTPKNPEKNWSFSCEWFFLDDSLQSLAPRRWDTAGQEAYEEARRVCYSDTHVLLIGFSLVEPDSLDNVETLWAKEANLEALKNAPVGQTVSSIISNFIMNIFFVAWFFEKTNRIQLFPRTDSINNSFLAFTLFCQKLLVGLKADLKSDEDTIEALAKRNLVREVIKKNCEKAVRLTAFSQFFWWLP